MTNQEIYDLMARFDGSGLRALKLSQGDFTIELEKAVPAAEVPAPAAVPAMAPAELPQAAEGPVISAPLVGTFYAAPAPEQAPFVSAGDRVKKGQTVCLLEAMKTMIEVPAPCDCVIGDILKSSGDLAAFGEALMRYTPC